MARLSKKWSVLATLAISSSTIVAGASTGIAQAASPQTLTWFTDVNWWTMGKWNTDPKTVEGAITKHFGLQFNFDVPAQDADTKLNLMLVTGKLPDIISLQDGATEQQLIKSGKVWNLQQLMKKYDPSALKQTFPPDLVKLETQQLGGFYGVPSWATTPDMVKEYPPAQKNSAYTANQAIIFNQHIMKQAGISLGQLKTEKGVLAALKKVANMHLTYKGAPIVALQMDNSGQWFGSGVEAVAQMFGAMPIDKKGNYRDLMFSPEMKHAIDFFFQAAQEGATTPGQVTLDTNGTNAAVRSGRAFCFIGNTANPHPETMWQTDPTETWVSAGPLLSNPYHRPTFGLAHYGLGWTQTFVSKSVSDPATIAKWLDYMYSYQGQLDTNYGVKGKDYTVDSRGLVRATAAAKNYPSTYWQTSGLGAFWFFNNGPFFSHVSPPPTDETNKMVNQFKSAYPASPVTYRYDSTALQMPSTLMPPGSKLYNDQKQITLYEESQVAKMIYASSKSQENQIYQQTISQLHKMGLDDIDAAINAQFHKQEKQFHEHIKGINP